jgi:hypothetical protein
LEFILQEDEFADIAQGNTTVDSSLVQDVLEQLSDTPLEEDPAEPCHNSQLHAYLLAVKNKIVKQTKRNRVPKCYQRGDFYEQLPHPVFGLQKSRVSGNLEGIDPAVTYPRDVFLWYPPALPGHPDKFHCTCGGHLSRWGAYNVTSPLI